MSDKQIKKQKEISRLNRYCRSREYTDNRKIKDLIFDIKNKYGDEVEIVSGGQRDEIL